MGFPRIKKTVRLVFFSSFSFLFSSSFLLPPSCLIFQSGTYDSNFPSARLAVIYRIINLLLYFEPAYMCTLQSDLIIAPLPAKKSLWEAGSARDWSEALAGRREPSHHHIPASSPPPLLPTLGDGIKEKSLALAADGGLVQLDDGQVYCSQGELQYQILSLGSTATKAADWEDWCAGMDGFGGLVMLAAELVV